MSKKTLNELPKRYAKYWFHTNNKPSKSLKITPVNNAWCNDCKITFYYEGDIVVDLPICTGCERYISTYFLAESEWVDDKKTKRRFINNDI